LTAQGKPVFTLLSDLTAPSRAGYVGVDPRQAGRTAAWAIRALARPEGEGAEVGVFVGSHRYLGQETCEIAFRSYLRENATGFRVLETRVNLEDERLAYEATQELLANHPRLDGLYVAGGGVPGILRALAEHGRHVVTVCTELTAERRRALVDGVIDLVIGTPLQRISSTAVAMMIRAIEQLAAGQPPMVAAHYPQPFDLYTPENIS
jgi:LacI family transcriptional regulator